MRAEALRDDGIAAACLLATLGRDELDEASDEERVRRYAGALLLVHGIRQLEMIRKLLTAPE